MREALSLSENRIRLMKSKTKVVFFKMVILKINPFATVRILMLVLMMGIKV